MANRASIDKEVKKRRIQKSNKKITDRKNINQLHHMELAIQEARRSRDENEDAPKVGAVAVGKQGEFINKAYHGQLDPGDHAEFTLLHKLIKGKTILEGSTLYTTLEPCVDAARSEHKRACVDWIIQKGVRKVVIGMLDPNPTICGRGSWRLIEKGVDIEFFPANLLKELLKINRRFIKSHRGGENNSFEFAHLLMRHRNRRISSFTEFGFQDELSLQDCPRFRDGWAAAEVMVELNNRPFRIPAHYSRSFKTYFRENYEKKRFGNDGKKFMLTKNPTAFSDGTSLKLHVMPTSYSVAQYYMDSVATVESACSPLIEDVVRGTLQANFAHSLSLHMIIVTSDRKLLLTKRSKKLSWHAGCWQVSLAEQIKEGDFDDGPDRVLLRWCRRLLEEEAGLGEEACTDDNLRILSIFLESDILNISICTHAEIRLDSKTLSKVLKSLPRTDYEFSDIAFLDLNRTELLSEAFRPARQYHPAAGYNLLWCFRKNYGTPTDSEILSLGL